MRDGVTNIATAFLNEQDDIKQVIAADVTLWDCWDNRMFFKSYSDTVVWPMADYTHLRISVAQDDYEGDSYIAIDYPRYENATGFLVYTRNNPVVDLYDGDVFFGTLVTTQNSQDVGIIIFDSSILDDLGNVYYDPVIN